MTENAEQKKLVWDLENSDPAKSLTVKEALSTVRDPELGMTIIQLGLIRNVQQLDNQLVVSMLLTTPYCPYGPALMEQARLSVENSTGMATRVDLLLDPWDFSMMEDGAIPEWGLF